MAYFIVAWDAGYGESVELVEFDNQEDAQDYAYQQWWEEVENQGNYSANPYSDEEAEAVDLVEEAIDLGIYTGEE